MKTIQEQLDIIKQEQRLGLMTHVVIGYPSLEETIERVKLMEAAGVDIIELQIPFSDPIADGPAITEANQQAIRNGVTVEDCIKLAHTLSKTISIPIQFIGYYNTVIHYGVEKFIADSVAAGIQGFTFPDLPFDEEPYEHFYATAHKYGLPVIQLISPLTTELRLQQIIAQAEGFLYCVARTGVTGTSTELPVDLADYLKRVRKYATLPIAVGFGISKPEHIQSLRGLADMAVVGSALLNIPTNQLANRLEVLCASR